MGLIRSAGAFAVSLKETAKTRVLLWGWGPHKSVARNEVEGQTARSGARPILPRPERPGNDRLARGRAQQGPKDPSPNTTDLPRFPNSLIGKPRKVRLQAALWPESKPQGIGFWPGRVPFTRGAWNLPPRTRQIPDGREPSVPAGGNCPVGDQKR